jgi:hypothetical protein
VRHAERLCTRRPAEGRDLLFNTLPSVHRRLLAFGRYPPPPLAARPWFRLLSRYSQRFGLVHVDFQTLKRTPKKSFYWLRALSRARSRPS